MYKAFLIFFICIFSGSKLQSQDCNENLIPNYSFEAYKSCLPFGSLFDSLSNWFIPVGGGSTDYYNACSPVGWVFAVPSAVAGYQFPRTGNGFIGVATFAKDANTGNMAYVKEYARVLLNKKLDAKRKYCIQFYAALSDSSNYKTRLLQCLFTNADSSIYSENIATQLAQITITKSFSDIIPGQWLLWQGSFIAKGDEEFLTLGNLQNDSIIDTLFISNLHYPSYYSYFFIDDVYLCNCDDLNTISFPNIFTPNNDDVNDVWFLDLTGFNNIEATIYNRWGIKIFEATTKKVIWDGRTNSGMECVSGIYFYVLKTNEGQKKGFIQLVR